MRNGFYVVAGLGLAVLALFDAGGSASAASATPQVTITLKGEPQTVFDWSRDACETWDVPDAPARAFRDAAGQVHLIASHFINRAFVGPNLDALRRDCTILFEGRRQDAPEQFDDRAWLSGFFTEDGRTVHALVHNEYQGNHRPWLCPSRIYMQCWRNAITYAVSRDGGRRFVQPKPPHNLIATPPYPYEGNLGHHVGYFNPTNIVKRDGFYYAMFSATKYQAQGWGACVMRTDRLDNPSSWRAWDGKGFSVRFVDPYREPTDEPGGHVCTPVGRGKLITPLGGIVRHDPSGAYLLTMAGMRRGVPGVYVAASWDLIEWSEPSLAWQVAVAPSKDRCSTLTYNYPSLIDMGSPDRNFASVGATADLYVASHSFKDCRPSPDRDLLRRTVRIEVSHVRQ